ncbi:DUF2141 domain-containing protein [Gimesia chilikensis]|uniref:DUF2141 domain-containing protein n=1 Tax=Gimesia chilikensis TaxID=2605989 RepID=UPI0018D704E3|nr:DUF2141 domain-containing protein [Gimesia chilikensis]
MQTQLFNHSFNLTFLMTCLLGQTSYAEENQSSLAVELSSIPTEGAIITVILFKDPKAFTPKMATSDRNKWRGYHSVIDRRSRAGKSVVRFDELVPGDYSVFVYCDLNSNKKLDTKFPGIPVEPIGTSNNIVPPRQRPAWDNTKIRLAPGKNVTKIKLVSVSR